MDRREGGREGEKSVVIGAWLADSHASHLKLSPYQNTKTTCTSPHTSQAINHVYFPPTTPYQLQPRDGALSIRQRRSLLQIAKILVSCPPIPTLPLLQLRIAREMDHLRKPLPLLPPHRPKRLRPPLSRRTHDPLRPHKRARCSPTRTLGRSNSHESTRTRRCHGAL